jgi:hypothetical protein
VRVFPVPEKTAKHTLPLFKISPPRIKKYSVLIVAYFLPHRKQMAWRYFVCQVIVRPKGNERKMKGYMNWLF